MTQDTLPTIARGEKPAPPASGQVLHCRDEQGARLAIVFCACGAQCRSKPDKTGETAKVPKQGWRKVAGEFVCGACIADRYYIRSFRLRITGLAGEPEEGGRTMDEFRRDLAAAAKESARYGNWLLQRLFAADEAAHGNPDTWPKNKAGQPKLPPCPTVDGYCPALFPDLSGAAMSALMQSVRSFYAEHRWECFVARNRSVQNYRFGYLPIELRAADWQLTTVEGQCVMRRLAVRPGKSWSVGVWAEGVNLQRMRQVASGEAIQLGAKIIRRSKLLRDGRRVKVWFIRAAAMLPRGEVRRRNGHQEITLTLGHDRACLLYGTLEGDDEPFEFPGVALRKLVVGGDIADRRRQQEQSMTRGLMPRRKHRRWSRDRTKACDNRARKIDYQLRLAAAALGRWCESHGVTSVDYETTDRQFAPHLPYCALKTYIANQLEQRGIALHVLDAGSDQTNESAALARPERETSA